jgi:hypothetical protein
MIYDELLYYFSGDFKEVRDIVNGYDKEDLKDAAVFGKFRKKLLAIQWNERKVDAFLRHWLDYASDLADGSEEDMPLDRALKDRKVDCEEHRTVANALLVKSGYPGYAVNMYYIPDDPEADGEGHATKVVQYEPNAVTVDNWGLINHYENGMGWIRDFIGKANYYDKLVGRWEGDEFVQEYVDEGTVEETAATALFEKIRGNLAEFVPTPKRFDASPLNKVDAEYMEGFIECRNRLIRTLDTYEKGSKEYANAVRQIKFRNQLLRRPDYSMKAIEVRS